MKKMLKYPVWFLLWLIVLLVIVVLCIRFVFRNEAANFAKDLLRSEYIEALQSAKPYVSDTINYSFELMSPNDKSKEVRDYFRLDTIIQGSADTWDKTLRIARIVASIKHDNPDPKPEKHNAIDLWEWVQSHPDGFNCRAHAIMLHEMLLSVGIANRVITCSPKDTTDIDCHVVNSVWLSEESRWVMVDSDNGGYITDEKGAQLSLEEMREKIINEEPLIFKRFDGAFIEQNDFYWYWAKNLYYFDSLEKQTYDVESQPNENYRKIYLVHEKGCYPKSFRPQYDVLTTDVSRFWASPDSINISNIH